MRTRFICRIATQVADAREPNQHYGLEREVVTGVVVERTRKIGGQRVKLPNMPAMRTIIINHVCEGLDL
jgi:KaiC/GvpD/RAD55 family RecA-like ATPase